MLHLLFWLFLLVVAASVAVGLLVAGLQRWADRTRHSDDDDPTTITEPVRHTEEERAALLAELAPPPLLTRREAAAALKAHRRELVVQRQISDDVNQLECSERAVMDGLDSLWQQAREVLELDDLDEEWAHLSSGELVTV